MYQIVNDAAVSVTSFAILALEQAAAKGIDSQINLGDGVMFRRTQKSLFNVI